MDKFFINLGGIIGIPDDQARMITGFLSVIPLGLIFTKIQCPKLRTYFGLVTGILLSLMVYQEGIISVIIQSIIVYELTKKITLKGSITAKTVFYETLVFVSAHHLYRQYTDYGGWKLDVTTILMMNTIKWTSFAYCYQDGLQQAADLSEEQNQRKITKIPSYLDYFGFIFFFCGCLAGPSYDYYDYEIFIKLEDVYSKIPSTIKESLRLLRNGFIYSFFIVIVYPRWSLESLLGDDFASSNIFYKSLWYNITITLHRTKYISGWYFSETGFAAAGFTYNGKVNNQDQWERIRSINPKLDLITNPKDKIDCWNMSVQLWLKRYVYLRSYSPQELKTSPSKQSKASIWTFVISGFWHGFYPAYYLSFFQWSLVGQINKYFYKLNQNTNLLKKVSQIAIKVGGISFNIYDLIVFYLANSLFNSYGVGFQLLNIQDNIKFYSAIYWLPSIFTFGLFGFFMFTGMGQRKRKSE